DAERRATRGRRLRRADRPRRTHRRALGGAPHERHRRIRSRVRHGRADGGRLLPRARRHRRGHLARSRLRAVRRPDLVRDLDARYGRGARVRERDPRAIPRQAARLQLLAVVQLAQAPGRRDDRRLPGPARRVGLQVPVHHARRLPLAERRHVRAGARLCAGADDGVRAAAGARVRARGVRLHGDAPPARGRSGLLRSRHAGRLARRVDARPQGLDRRSAIHSLTGNDVLSPEALAFVERLHRELNPTRLRLLERRRERQRELDAGVNPRFLPETRELRESEWRVAPAPPDLVDRRCEITGPVERKMMINALNSGARVFMADFEDANSPTWENVVQGQANVRDALRREISLDTGEKRYELNDEIATLMIRPRGWHMVERHHLVDGEPISASLFDFGLAYWSGARY